MRFSRLYDDEEESARKMERIRAVLSDCDAVIVGAGAGLSTSAGFTYSGSRFKKHFADFEERYGFTDMYSGGFFPYETLEEFWAYWSRYIFVNRYMDPPKPVYADLLALVGDKDYFVITTNVDHCFQKAGFAKERLYYTQGDYGLFQCSVPCHQSTYDNEETVSRMVSAQNFSADIPVAENPSVRSVIPSELVPKCPVCGKPMSMNLRADGTFVQDEGWYAAAGRYEQFLTEHRASSDGKVLFLELGVGSNTPGIIKYPFWQMTARNRNATYACINFGEAVAPKEIEGRSICVNGDIAAKITSV